MSADQKLSFLVGEPVSSEGAMTLPELLVDRARNFPNAGTYYVAPDGNETFQTYGDLLSEARSAQSRLMEAGLKPGDAVLIEVDDDRAFYKAFWGCLLGGFVPAAVNSPGSFAGESAGLRKILDVAAALEPRAMIYARAHAAEYLGLAERQGWTGIAMLAVEDLEGEAVAEVRGGSLSELAYVQFTSGSTGEPKGVRLTHAGLWANFQGIQRGLGLKRGDVLVSWLPHTHDMGLIGFHLEEIFVGISTVKIDPATFIRNPRLYLEKLARHGTVTAGPNFGLAWLTEKVGDAELAGIDLTRVRAWLNGAEPISIRIMENFLKRFDRCGLKRQAMFTVYGMAEPGLGVAFPPIGAEPRIRRLRLEALLAEGRAEEVRAGEGGAVELADEGGPIPGISIRIVDGEDRVLPQGRVGEIQISGPSVCSGYCGRRARREEDFCGEWLRTGDLGFVSDGRFVVTGRKHDIVPLRGRMHYAHCLEETLQAHREFKLGQFCVASVPDPRSAEPRSALFVKFRKPLEQFLPLALEARALLREKGGVVLDHILPVPAIPKTTSGKVQRFKLCEELLEGRYEEARRRLEGMIAEAEKAGGHRAPLPGDFVSSGLVSASPGSGRAVSAV